jgi:hypothetical protein
MGKVLGPIVLLVGLAAVTYAAATLSMAARRARSWVRTVGTVIDSQDDSNSDSDTTILRLQVRFEGPHGPVTFWNRYGSSIGGRLGRQVLVRYNPHDDTDAVIAGGAHGPTFNGLFFLLIGVVFTAVGTAVTWFAMT